MTNAREGAGNKLSPALGACAVRGENERGGVFVAAEAATIKRLGARDFCSGRLAAASPAALLNHAHGANAERGAKSIKRAFARNRRDPAAWKASRRERCAASTICRCVSTGWSLPANREDGAFVTVTADAIIESGDQLYVCGAADAGRGVGDLLSS